MGRTAPPPCVNGFSGGRTFHSADSGCRGLRFVHFCAEQAAQMRSAWMPVQTTAAVLSARKISSYRAICQPARLPSLHGELLYLGHCLRDSGNAQHNHCDGTFQKNVAVVVDNRIDRGQCLREALRHVLHPEQVSADGVRQAPEQCAGDVSLDQSVLCIAEQTGRPQQRKGQQIVKEDLEEGKKIGLLQKLHDAVHQADQHARCCSVPVSDQHDEEHGEQGDGSAVRQAEQMDIRGDKGQCQRHRAEGKLLRAQSLALCNPGGDGPCGDQNCCGNDDDQHISRRGGNAVAASAVRKEESAGRCAFCGRLRSGGCRLRDSL